MGFSGTPMGSKGEYEAWKPWMWVGCGEDKYLPSGKLT